MTDKKVEKKYAVVDLEATSASATAQIIQVGIVIIEQGKIVQTYETDVNPHESLTKHITDLTGITDEQLSKAPDFSEVASPIFELIKDCIFVAHNVKFDANLLAEHLFFNGYELRTPRVDTVELSQVFYPTMERYRLSDLSLNLKLNLEHAHTAIADAYATAELLLKLREKIANLPKLTVENILAYADNLLFESRLVIDEVFSQMSPELPKGFVEVHNLVVKKPEPLLSERHLAADFTRNLALLDLDERPAQLAFAGKIAECYDDPRPVFIQGQAGIGKTYGYLLPLLSKVQDQKIIVTVPTKALQDQIMNQEGRRLAEVFHINCHSLKSPQNYIKLDNFAASLEREDKNRLVNRYKMKLLVWLTQTRTGSLDEIRQKQRFEAYFDEIRHDGNLSNKSAFWDIDFWNLSYERSKSCRVLVTNHAYFLTRIEDDKDFIKGHILVVDEAQKLFLNLEQFSRRQVKLNPIMKSLHELLEKPANHLQKRILESLQFELSNLIVQFYQNNQKIIPKHQVEKIRQDLLEVNSSDFLELKEALAPVFSDFWLSQEWSQEHRLTDLNSARSDLMTLSNFLPETAKSYFVSATLDISDRVSLPNLLGFEDYDFIRLPQEATQGQTIWLDSSMPNIPSLSSQDYASILSDKVKKLRQLRQPILVLFTAKEIMFSVSELLDEAHINHLCQHKNGHAANIKNRFDKGESSILLGTGAFWEGVDFANQDRLIEVITRLPFDNPQEHFTKKLKRQLSLAGKKPFYDYSLPVTVLRLKQAIGRSKRKEYQRSAVVILDNRILSKSYGPLIYQSLNQEFPLKVQNFDRILSEMAQFFKNI
ncbi:bifunctional DnaQ family exonuclease/ATP-dependent helicase [Streptococcus dentapri]|uniref:3'-5' exonuclease DinG n=1 Tax=Streptococcus dentapri TaxID=573564 RepID=A0ABV8D3A5_9STRE